MNNKFSFGIGILIVVTFVLGCISTPSTKQPVSTPSLVNVTPYSPQSIPYTTPINRSWLYEGPIYQTHPYFYDGTFKTLTKQIPYIADLGIKTVYLMPIWEHEKKEPSSNYIYLINDYSKIDSAYGTEEELKELVDTVHKNEMKIIFDLVTCCAAPGSKPWLNDWTLRIPLSELKEKTKKLGKDLQYVTNEGYDLVYYGCKKEEAVKCEFMGRIAGDNVMVYYYPVAQFGPVIDRSNPEAIDYFTKAAEFYVKEYNIDGWRLDVPQNDWNRDIITGDHSSLELLRSAKRAISNNKPNSIFLGEFPDLNPSDSALDEVSEASYSHFYGNYMYLRILKGEINSEEFLKLLQLENEKTKYNSARIRVMETPGSPRINKIAPSLNRPLIVLASTIPGIPMIQAGQEIGAVNEWMYQGSGKPQVDWTKGDNELRKYYKKVFGIRNNNTALKYGKISNIWKSGNSIYAYSRSYENETAIIVVNFLDKEATSILDLSFLKKGNLLHDEMNDENFIVTDPDNFKITLPAYGSRILV